MRLSARCLVLFALTLLFCATAGSEPQIPSGRIFYAPFDGGLDAAEAQGNPQAESEGHPAFVPGRKGQGVVVGDLNGSTSVFYQAAGNFSLERGTVSFWLQPLNWRGDDDLYHNFFTATPGEKGTFLLYKYHRAAQGLTFLVDPDDGPRNKMSCDSAIKDWKPGEWRHVAIAWTRNEGMALYVDGKQAASVAAVSLTEKPLKPRLRFGSDWQLKGCRTVLDEAMIFSRMLAPHEIAVLADRPASPPPPDDPRDVPGVTMAHAILGQHVLARVYRDCLGEPMVEEARLGLKLVGQEKTVAEKLVKLTGTPTPVELDLKPLPKGRYEARLWLLSQGAVRAVESLIVSKETDHTWETAAEIAKEDMVLPPFTPLAVTGGTVRCLGRAYEFGDGALPAKLRSRNEELLAGPVRVVAVTASGPVQFSWRGVKASEASPTQVSLTGELDSPLLDVAVESLARYDGTIWTALRFHPKSAVEVKGLRIEVPLAEKHTKYLAFVAPSRIDEKRWGYDALPAGQGIVWRREFLPSIWIGSDERGLGWYGESDEYWDDDGDEALTVERGKDAVTLSMNVIRRPRKIAEEFTIEFGLQATPVRDLSPDWRAYQPVPYADYLKFILYRQRQPSPRPDEAGPRPRGKVCYVSNYHWFFSNTLPKDPQDFREMLQCGKGFGLLCTPYTDMSYQPANAGDMWIRGPVLRALPGAHATSYGPVCNVNVCHRGPYGDWFAWYMSHLVREYGTNGIYLDDMWPYGCANAAHGCGYTGPDGRRRVTYALRAWNETYRRIRTIFAATHEPFWMTCHISGGRVPPLPTFGDGLLLAEDRNPIVGKNPDYTVNTAPAQWIAGFYPGSWGIPVYFIPQFKMNNSWMKDPDLAARLVAAATPYDLMIWPVFADVETIMKARGPLEKFGIGEPDTRFLPYWAEDTGVRAGDNRIKLSAYLRPGRLLLCPANWSSDPVGVLAVELDPARLGLPAKVEARDAVTGEQVPVREGRIKIAIPAKRLRLVEVTGKP